MFQAASDSLQPDEYMEYSIAAIRHNKKMQEYTQTNQVDRIKFAVALIRDMIGSCIPVEQAPERSNDRNQS